MHGDVRLLAGKSNPSWKIVWKCLKSEASFLTPKMASRTRKLPWHLLAINICMPSPDQHWIKHLDFWNPKIWENMPNQNYDKLVIMPVGAAWVFRGEWIKTGVINWAHSNPSRISAGKTNVMCPPKMHTPILNRHNFGIKLNNTLPPPQIGLHTSWQLCHMCVTIIHQSSRKSGIILQAKKQRMARTRPGSTTSIFDMKVTTPQQGRRRGTSWVWSKTFWTTTP